MNLKRLYWQVGWHLFILDMLGRESRRGVWLFAGHLGISFKIIPRLFTKLYIKKGEKKGIRVSQFGPLVLTWEERRKKAA